MTTELFTNTVRLPGQEPIREVVDLTTGSHQVYQVNGSYVVKRGSNMDAAEREAMGLYLFGRLTEAVPTMVKQGEGYVVAECLPLSMTAGQAISRGLLSTEQVVVFVASFMAEVYWGFQQRRDMMRMFPFLRWKSQVNRLLGGIQNERLLLAKVLGSKQYGTLVGQLQAICAKTAPHRLTLLHRDIHLDNILFSSAGTSPRLMVIDMEHCMEGPVELELQNALFWADQKAVDVAAVRQLLVQEFRVLYEVRYERGLMGVYISDQLLRTLAEKDMLKLRLVADRAKRFLGG